MMLKSVYLGDFMMQKSSAQTEKSSMFMGLLQRFERFLCSITRTRVMKHGMI